MFCPVRFKAKPAVRLVELLVCVCLRRIQRSLSWAPGCSVCGGSVSLGAGGAGALGEEQHGNTLHGKGSTYFFQAGCNFLQLFLIYKVGFFVTVVSDLSFQTIVPNRSLITAWAFQSLFITKLF